MNSNNTTKTHTYYKALKIASHIFCTSICTNTCRTPYNIHQQSYTLLPEIANHPHQNFYYSPLPKNNPITDIQEPPKPPRRIANRPHQKSQDYPIITIINTKHSKRKDKFGTTKVFTSYKCTWTIPDNQN